MPTHAQVSDALELAQKHLESLMTQLGIVRDDLLQATQRWSAAQGVKVGNRLYGRLLHNDPAYVALRQAVLRKETLYRSLLLHAIPALQVRVQQLETRTLQESQEAWCAQSALRADALDFSPFLRG